MNSVIGQKFGRLTVVSRVRSRDGRRFVWQCKCECGLVKAVRKEALIAGRTQSCGCLYKERVNVVLHGLSRSSLYDTWVSMKKRCYNEKTECYPDYGGRGIRVCDRWLYGENGKHPVLCFAEDMGLRPAGLSLDRIDVNGDYEPANCRWSSRKEQQSNKRPRAKLRDLTIPILPAGSLEWL